ncbi:MAG: transglutaminase-like domain-containing protein [Candidatus Heimdallarchaeota archaeon]
MEVKPYINTDVGDIPLLDTNVIKNGEKLRLTVSLEPSTKTNQNITRIVVLNPFDKQVVTGKIPTIDSSKIAFLEVVIPDHWISGRYTANVLDLANKVVKRCHFYLTHKHPYQQSMTNRTIKPNWQMHYRITVRNPTDKPIGNFSSFVALPITLLPQQLVKNLNVNPSNLKISTDLDGNQWIHYEIERLNPNESVELGYSAVVESRPLLLSRNINGIKKNNPYKQEFLKKYLNPEPHIESNHPAIVKIASTIQTDDPIAFAKKATRQVNRILTYKIQPGEFGAAFAIEKKEGDCTEYAALFVALCRAAGIPARTNAGFAFTEQKWERHATAEFLVAGRWLPIDVTGQTGTDIFIGHLPNYILITRGNWMGGTLAKEVSYRYQVMETTQKLQVDIDWKIALADKSFSAKKSSIAIVDKTVKILESKVVEPSKVKILDNQESETLITLREKPSTSKSQVVKLETSTQKPKRSKAQQISIVNAIPDVLKDGLMKNQSIRLQNNTDQTQRGCFEIRLVEDNIIKLLSYRGVKISPKSELVLKPKLQLEKIGINKLQFVFLNRIGRALTIDERKISVY